MFKGNRNLSIITLITVVSALGYGIIIPVLYSYSKKYGLSDFENGLLFALFSLCQFVSTPIIGRLSDKYGRKPLLVISILGTALSFLMMAFAPTALFLFIARALDGITAGNIPVASAVITDTTAPKDRAKGFGIIGAAFGFGFIFGPVISGLTVGINPALPFIIAAAISLVAVIATALYLPETNKSMGKIAEESLFNIKKLVRALGSRTVGATLLLTLTYFMALSIFFVAFQSATVSVLKMSVTEISLLFSLFGVIGLICQTFVLRIVVTKYKPKQILYFCLASVALVYLGMFFANTILLFTITCIGLAIVNSFVQPLTQTILSEEVSETEQGEMQGFNTSYMSIGQIIGPILAGALATVSVTLPFVGAAIFTALCLFLAQKIFKDVKKEII